MTSARARLLTAVLAASLAALAACSSSAAPSPSQSPTGLHGSGSPGTGPAPGPAGHAISMPAPASVSWHSCAGAAAGGTLRCGTLAVPLDYRHPGGRKLSLALTEVPATAPASQQQGIMLANPGGPGGSGTSLATFVAQGLQPSVAARYTIIGFDPRGVGASVPAMHCEPSFYAKERPDYVPKNRAAEQVMVSQARAYAAGCEKRFGWMLPDMTTVNVAKDMDQIRASLGQRQLTYFGYSYGTYIGMVYATLFPQRVRKMVLDSIVDPTGVWYGDNIEQDYAFQGRMNAFFAWVARYSALYRLGARPAEVSKSWHTARARLEAHPVAHSGGPSIGPDEFDDTFLAGGYDNGWWPAFAAALASYLHHGQTQQLVTAFNQAGKQNENEFAVYNAVECADVAWPRNWAKWDADTRKVYRVAPFEAWDNAWYNAACAFWPVHGPARPMRIGAAGLPGILMLQGTLDAATPYAGAQRAHRMLPTARMVVVVGGGNHGQSLAYPPNACVDGYLNRYLDTGALPARPGLVNATCPALPDPVPAG